MSRSRQRRVVITGLGCVSPVGNTVAEAWNAVLEGRSGIATITKFDAMRRQLDAALTLWFANGDPVAIHTIVSASHEIIHRLFTAKGLKHLLLDTPMVKPQYRKLWEPVTREDLEKLGVTPDVVVVGASGGGLIAGIALAIKARVPGAKFYSAEPEGFDDTMRSFQSGKRETNPRMSGTICDALMTSTPGVITWEINKKLVGEGVSASDAEVGRAVAFAFRELKLVVEPGGAIGLAALLAGKLDIKGKVVVAVLSGGNVDADLFHRLIAA